MEAYANYALLAAAIPFCLWATWSDLRYMKIPNMLVLAMTVVFLIVGAVFLPFDEYLWRILGGVIVLVGGFVLFALGGIGGGDAKFAAAMALFIDRNEVVPFLFILSIVTILAVLSHWIVGKLKFARPITGSWDSWTVKKKFPFGFGMGAALIYYLVIRALA